MEFFIEAFYARDTCSRFLTADRDFALMTSLPKAIGHFCLAFKFLITFNYSGKIVVG